MLIASRYAVFVGGCRDGMSIRLGAGPLINPLKVFNNAVTVESYLLAMAEAPFAIYMSEKAPGDETDWIVKITHHPDPDDPAEMIHNCRIERKGE